jgi:hypothetical protein
MRHIVLVFLVALLAWGLYSRSQHRAMPQPLLTAEETRGAEEKPVDFFGTATSQPVESRTATTHRVAATSAAPFACDGRTRCSQMHSCEEANYFLRNCPGVKMDGDNDGIPCEREFCAQ